MTFVVVYDACVLYGNTQRDMLIRVAQSGLVQAKWTTAILELVLRPGTRSQPGPHPGLIGARR